MLSRTRVSSSRIRTYGTTAGSVLISQDSHATSPIVEMQAESDEIRLVGPDRERSVPADSLLTAKYFYGRSDYYVPNSAVAGYEQLQSLLLVRFLVPSIRPAAT